MKNFFSSIVVQLIAIVTAVSGIVVVVCVIGLALNFNNETLFILAASVVICIAGYTILRIKKVTFDAFLDSLWPGGLPW